MAKLLPCPFCGGKVEHYHTEQISFYKRKIRFRCNQCNGLFYFFDESKDRKEAVKIWNTHILTNCHMRKAEARVTAIKEFAERLKTYCAIDRGFAVMPDDVIDNLVKEMTEE